MAKAGGSSRHVELERKFDVEGATLLPSFDGLSVVSRAARLPMQALEAVYFDTAANDLAARRVTLRRRTGGADAGWHLKLPSGSEARTEIHAPLGSGTDTADVPEELLDVVLAIVRDRPLAPVARIATSREVTMIHGIDGNPVAEFCDDRVSAARINTADGTLIDDQAWREWELELVDAGVDGAADLLNRLGNRLIDAGATPSGHGSKLAKVLGDTVPRRSKSHADPVHRAVSEQVELLLEWDRAVRADAYDSVHQMRVATRQIRSLLQASEDAFGLTDDAWILNELRELAAVLGTARDAEVLAESYSTALDALEPELVRGPVRERLVEGARRQYQLGLRRSWAAMRSPRYFRLLDALEGLVVTQPPEGQDTHPPATIESSYRRVRKAVKASREAADNSNDDALHRIRKAAKRLRYVAAATGDSRVAGRSKIIQSLLGDHQDSVISRAHLLRQADAAHAAGEDTFTYGVLYAQKTEVGDRCRAQLDDALTALRRSVREARRGGRAGL
jgi:CHAD domain-containing protein